MMLNFLGRFVAAVVLLLLALLLVGSLALLVKLLWAGLLG